MSSFRRLLILGMFASCGVALAIGFAMSHQPIATPRDSVVEPVAKAAAEEPPQTPAVVDVEPTEAAPPTGPINPLRDASAPRSVAQTKPPSGPARPQSLPFASAAPVRAQPHPPVAEQVTRGGSEAVVPVSTMLDFFDRWLKQRQPEPVPQARQPFVDPLPPPQPAPSVDKQPPPAESSSTTNVVDEGSDRLTLHLKDSDIREVLDLLSQGSGRNILATKSVQGTVTATLQNVPFETALRGILKSTGFVAHREGNIVYIGTREEFEADFRKDAKVITRIYRPNYIRATDLQNLITPLLTPEIGTVSVSSPAEVGISSDGVNAGGDTYADQEVVLVVDFPWVLDQVDQVFQEIDRRPMQVAIEAMILSVKLDDSNRLGVNFELLRNRENIRLLSGKPLQDLATLDFTDGGLKIGFLDSDLSLFLDALETIGETDIIATPRLLALNKQRAEILIGAELGYVSTTVTETAQTQTVEFLEVGTQLRIRPFISSDGLVRMEIHPELSTGNVRVEGGFTLPDKEVTQVTTNIMAQDGATVIIGGLIREDLTNSATQIPFFGSLPVVGTLFRQKIETIDRRELLVLITPHILYEPEASEEGNQGAMEFHHRHAVEFQKSSPLGKRHISQRYLLKAQNAWAEGDARLALKFANLAIHYNPLSRAAIDFRADITEGIRYGDHTKGAPFHPASTHGQGAAVPVVEPWILDQLDPATMRQYGLHPQDAGSPGTRSDIVNPRGS